ncbi:MAG: hypothetical protein P1U46_04310 [Patescibacteria group bacterium]|nr:hypothetical protein [Patescibacteria group bacterium]
MKNYKKILKSRNMLLKAIRDEKAKEEDIVFWDKSFIDISVKIYTFRLKFINFLKESIINTTEYFS